MEQDHASLMENVFVGTDGQGQTAHLLNQAQTRGK